MKGGYKMIDFKSVSIVPAASPTAVTIDGIYDSLEANYGKATLCVNLVINAVEVPERFVTFTVSNDNYTATIPEGTLAITDDDEVTITTN